MNDDDLSAHYKMMITHKITRKDFYTLIKDVPTSQLMRVVRRAEWEQTKLTAFIVTTFASIIVFLLVLWMFYGRT
jgi:hypothetical protein